ncbi:MAG: methyltransferase domain-containing protein [Legionellaceae bacterium]|nr:methyltransferase domain-containing protein [Legionellaceae bacterium]
MKEINLLKALPNAKRNVQVRKEGKSADVISIAKQFGEMYFDGPREFGYGGYRYDGRWIPVANDMVEHFDLKPGDRVLDVGCAKGFLVRDLMHVCPGLEVFGLDLSTYALKHCHPDVVGRLHLGSADELPFPDHCFDAVISINTIHNFKRDGVAKALDEIQRVSKGKSFVQVDSYHTEEQKKLFEEWVLTAEFHDYPDEWIKLFNTTGYTGDYYWTVLE